MLNIHQSPSQENRGIGPARPIPAPLSTHAFSARSTRAAPVSRMGPPVLTDVKVALDRAHNIHEDARGRRQRAASFGDEAIVEREPRRRDGKERAQTFRKLAFELKGQRRAETPPEITIARISAKAVT